nr:pre-toxin TG domain-containing protein [Halalkalibacter oceani]
MIRSETFDDEFAAYRFTYTFTYNGWVNPYLYTNHVQACLAPSQSEGPDAVQEKIPWWKELASTVVGFIPFAGNAKAGYEAIDGRDPITGRELEDWEQALAAAAIVGGGLVKAGSRGAKIIGGVDKGIGKGEQVLDKVKTYEQARNKAIDLVGDLGPNSQPYTGTLKSSAGYGQVVGRQSADGKVRWRLDYDPNKGPHINIEDFRNGKGANARKIAVPFEGNESTFKSLLKHLNR